MTSSAEPVPTSEEIPVAQVLQQIRIGIRQRQAELAALGHIEAEEKERVDHRVRELYGKAHIQERPFASSAPIVGRLIVFVRNTWNSVASKWYVRPMVHQQNLYNHAVAQILHELLDAQTETRQRVEQVFAYLEQVDERLISLDKDLTLLARKVAEGEYRLRQRERRAQKGQAVNDSV